MTHKLGFFLLPVILLFAGAYEVTEMGAQGRLEHRFLREKLYPVLSFAPNTLTDLKFKARGRQKPKHKIVILDIDSPALETLGRWPWHRDVIAFLVEKTFAAGAKVVGLDMIFSEPDPRVPAELGDILRQQNLGDLIQKFETDRQLEDVIRLYSDRLVLAWATELQCQPFYDEPQFCPVQDPSAKAQFGTEFEKFSIQKFEFPPGFDPGKTPLVSFVTPIANIAPYTAAANHMGYINAFLDPDGYIRRSGLVVMANGKPYPSLALTMASVGLQEPLRVSLDSQNRIKALEFSKSSRSIPVSPLGALQINFRGPSDAFPHIPALDVMGENDTVEDPLNRRFTGMSKTEILKDAYVLIGISALGVFDMRQFPFESNAPGVDGHANILDNLLSGDPLVPGHAGFGAWVVFLLMIVGVGLFAFATARLESVPALILFLVTMATLWYWDFKLLFENNYNWNTVYLYLETIVIFFLTLAAKYVMEEKNKKFIRGAFAKYVAPQIVESIMKDPTKLSLGGEKRDLTILFSDIRGFTTFSEKMDAKALASFLNDYLGVMTGLVFSNEGTLDKYIGDAIMAFWGAPLHQKNHALNSCRAAVQMMEALFKNQARFMEQYGIEVNIGIGINSGVVNVGNMGSETNFEYTVIGDNVNLASRLEGLTKKYGVAIVTTRFTFDSIAESGNPLPPHRLLDDVKVKGKKKSVELLQLLERELPAEGLKLFDQGRALYRKQQWKEAIECFQSANRLLAPNANQSDGPCEVFIERCEMFQKEPPPADWDGSWEMDSK
jgi:adenylate cyclase